MRFNSLAFRISGPALLVGLLVISLLGGCRHSLDPLLAKADSMMEEHPDSSLLILADYHLSPGTSAADSADYALLLTHARYKNFIDETDDSLISLATKYFLAHGDEEKASRALFLQGMIQLNAQRLGEAAVSFSKGLDAASEGKCYMWEGQCARGLLMLYGLLHDGSSQVEYAKQALEAFSKTEDEGWKSYSKLELARSYNNNYKYKESICLLTTLINDNAIRLDTFMLAEVYQMKGKSMFGLANFQESIYNYARACELNPEILNESDKRIIKIAIHELYRDSVPSNIEWLIDEVSVSDMDEGAFGVLASQGKYEDAYNGLRHYKNQQDSILKIIKENNVSESLYRYKELSNFIIQQNVHTERMWYWIIILIIASSGVVIMWIFREKAHKAENLRLKTEADMESLRSDLMSQLEDFVKKSKYYSQPENRAAIENYEKIIKQKYAEANRLCDNYYQWGINKDDNGHFESEINKIVNNFTEKSCLDSISEYVDEVSGGLFSSFRNDFFNLSEENFRLFLYLMLGFNSRSISVLISQKVSAVYNKKARLKATIMNSNVSGKEAYLRFFGK